MSGNVAKYVVRIIMIGGKAVVRAFMKTLWQEIEASEAAARRINNAHHGEVHTRSHTGGPLSLEEAKLILNVKDVLNVEEIAKNFEHLFNVNEKRNGGSFYLQSKVFRAKERIDEELKRQSQRQRHSNRNEKTAHKER